jgi:membrane-associated phospholipid phosphatase
MQHTLSSPPNARLWFAIATMLIAAGVFIQYADWHSNLMLVLNQAATRLPDTLWSCLTVTGLGWSVLILVSSMHRGDLGARLVLTAFILGGTVTHTIKPFLGLPRPGEVLPLDLLHFIGNPVINYHSMPSGHALAALTMGTLWFCLIRTQQLPKWLAAVSWSLVLGIAASRVAVAAHWPADVLVGSGLGMMVGWVAWRFPFAWPRHTPNAFPWLPVLVESLGAFAAFTINEGMPLALIWQGALGGIAVMSILWRIHSWRASRSTETTA